MILSEESRKLDKAVNAVLDYVGKISGNNPDVVRMILNDCLHKIDMVGKIKGKLDDVVVK